MFVFSLFTSNNATALREAQIGQHIMPFNTMLRFVTVCTISYLLLGRVDLRAQRPIVIKLSRGRPVGLCVGLSSALWKNGGSVLDAVWHRRSDGSIGMRQVVAFEDRSTGRRTFGGEFGAPYCNQWGLYGVRVDFCSDAALFPNYFGHTCYRLLRQMASHIKHNTFRLTLLYYYYHSGGARSFHLGGYSPGFLGTQTSPVGSRGKAPVGNLGELKQFQILFTDFDYRNHPNLRISHNLPSDCMFYGSGVSDPFGKAASVSPCLTPSRTITTSYCLYYSYYRQLS